MKVIIWEVQVCGTYDFGSSALNNVAILGTREKIIEWIRRAGQAVRVVWSEWLRGRVVAWARGCVGLCRTVEVRVLLVILFLWMSLLNVRIFLCWTFILCIKIKNVDRTASQSQTLICYFEWSLHFLMKNVRLGRRKSLQSKPEYPCSLLQYMEPVVLNAGHSCSMVRWIVLPRYIVNTY